MTTQVSIARSNAKDLTKINTFKIQNRNAAAIDRRKVIAIDTETDSTNGNIFLIAASDGSYIEHPNINFENIAKFLMRYDEGYWIFFYNLKYDAGCILKLIPQSILNQYRRRKSLIFEYLGYVVEYRNNKQLTIRKGRHSVSCYDIMQYYDNKKLEDAYTDNIKKPLDEEYRQIKENRKIFSLGYYLRHKKQIRDYCINDCILTKELSEHWLNIFNGMFHFYPRNWISSGYIAEKVLINNNIEIPYFSDIHYEIQDLAWKSFYGGRFELIQRGFIGKCFLYDINSAYPFALSTFPNILEGTWKFNLKKIYPGASLGFFHIHAFIDNSVIIAPFPFRTKNGMIIYPCGEFETFVTLEELKAVYGDPRIKYKILNSYQFIPDLNCTYPFKGFIETNYYNRLRLKREGNSLERAIKIVLNSIYGKTAQKVNNTMGNLFNPIIASFITGYTRAQLYQFMKNNNLEKEVVAFATDSIAVRKEIPGLNSDILGEMKLDKKGDDAYFLSNGFYRFGGKWKNRGVGYDRERKVKIEHLDTKVGEGGELYISVKANRNTNIKGGILLNKIKSIGKIEEYEKKINLNSDKKRFWLEELRSVKDTSLCDSAPINISLVADILSKKSDILWKEENEENYSPNSQL
jgi:hypothetical protein